MMRPRLAARIGAVVLWGSALMACNPPAPPALSPWAGNPNTPCRDVMSFRAHALQSYSAADRAMLQSWQPPRPASLQQKALGQHMAQQYVEQCGMPMLLDVLTQLVHFRSTSDGSRDPNTFAAMETYLRNWALHNHLHFETFGQDDVWEIVYGSGPHDITFVTHIDVAPAGDGWAHDPFALKISDNAVSGRGVEDDKGPVAAAMVVLHTLAAFGLLDKGRVTLAMGTAEETDWHGMQRYAVERPRARHTLSLNGPFPVGIGEDGFASWHLAAPLAPVRGKGAVLEHVSAGEFFSQVPGSASATFRPASGEHGADLLKKIQSACGREAKQHKREPFGCKAELDGTGVVKLRVTGYAVHPTMPEHGSNALWWLARLVRNLDLAQNGASTMLRIVADYFTGDLTGSKLGLAYRDPVMGTVWVVPTLLHIDGGQCRLDVNIRRPQGSTAAEFTKLLAAATEVLRAKVDGRIDQYAAPEVDEAFTSVATDRTVSLLTSLYGQLAHVSNAKPVMSRNATYARLFSAGLSLGPLAPGAPLTAHTPRESISVAQLQFLLRMYFDTVLMLQS